MKIYVAGASSEIERAEAMMQRLMLANIGIEIVSTWTHTVRKVGDANPPAATQSQRREWAQQDLREVESANVLLLLLPGKGHATTGAWAELGCAYKAGVRAIGAGSHSSVFTGLLDELYPDDDGAFKAVCRLAALAP